ncbi:MAG: DUF1460 domain-containing protein [Legionellaceae bacterium]|nr:DUF1460 domain-containing protein [Legionellaceae bacterium]
MPNIILYLLLLISIPSFAAKDHYPTCAQTNGKIQAIFKRLDSIRFKDFPSKIAYINKQFINKPYSFNALGEGANGQFDQTPLYSLDVFDCETYVDTVMALALATDLSSFQRYIKKIRYKQGVVSFLNRNHFTCLDWNVNNQNQGLVKDITKEIHNKNNQSLALIATTCIDKNNWYKNMSINRIRIPEASDTQKQKKLLLLRKKGQELSKYTSKIPYIPLNALFKKSGEANLQVFKQIPNGSIVEIVRPNWNLRKLIGTNLNVSHLGFVIWEKDTPYFVHASSDKLIVMKTPFIEYLRNAQKNPLIQGVNVQTISSNHTQSSSSEK